MVKASGREAGGYWLAGQVFWHVNSALERIYSTDKTLAGIFIIPTAQSSRVVSMEHSGIEGMNHIILDCISFHRGCACYFSVVFEGSQ